MYSWGRGPLFLSEALGGGVLVRWEGVARVGDAVCSGDKARVAELAVSHAVERSVRQGWGQI